MQHSQSNVNCSDADHSLPHIIVPIWEHANNRPDQWAVKEDSRAVSYAQLKEMIEHQMVVFREGGISISDPVLLLLDVCIESVVAYWALHGIGAILVIGDPTGTQSNIEHYLDVSGAKNIVCGARADTNIETAEDKTRWAIVDEVTGQDIGVWQTMHPASCANNDGCTVLPADCALILFSSGTTSTPKAIVHSRDAMQALHKTLLQTWRLSSDDVVLGALPFHTIYGLIFSAASALYAGSTLVLLDRFHPERALEAIERHKVTTAAFVPAMIIMILNLEGKERFDRSTVRMLYSASAPISETDIKRFVAFSGAPVICNYGMTEIPGAAVEVAGNDHVHGSVGLVSPDFGVTIRNEKDQILPIGETGEVALRGPTLMLKYLGDPDKTADRVRDGWIYTQDKGRIDGEGNIFLLGRKSEMIIRGGLNISPLEIESVLSIHPWVSDVAVVGPDDEVFGQTVSAFVVPSLGSKEQGLVETLMVHCKNTLAPPKVPSEFLFTDEIPRNAGGKIDRKALLEMRNGRMATPKGKS